MYDYDGYLELAATNDIILVYPESHRWNAGGDVEQAEGAYLTKDGLYPKAFMAMICRLTSASEETSNCPRHSEEYEHQVSHQFKILFLFRSRCSRTGYLKNTKTGCTPRLS